MNKVILQGRLTANPETRYTQSNMVVANASVAVDTGRKKQDGSKETDFFNLVAFDKTAEFLSKHFIKGQQLIVEGRLKNDKWQDQQGQNRISTSVIIDKLYFSGSRPKTTENETEQPKPEVTGVDNDYGEDLPF